MSDIINKKYKELGSKIDKTIEYEKSNMFFSCKTNNHRYKFEKASEYNFSCSKFGESLNYQDNADIIVDLLNKKVKYKSLNKSQHKYHSYTH